MVAGKILEGLTYRLESGYSLCEPNRVTLSARCKTRIEVGDIERAKPRMGVDFASRWYVVQTHPHAESKASAHLRRQDFTVYLPYYLKQRRHARRIEKVRAPLFPGYLFVSIDTATQRWLSIDSTFGVTKLVRDGDRAG